MNEEFVIDKSKMFDSGMRMYTQSLFLEIGYSPNAIYTFKDRWHEYEGKMYAPIRKFYMEMADPTEYEFANKYFINWAHWKRICDNRFLRRHIDEWRDELELKLRADGIKSVMKAAEGGSFQAAKWLADRGWDTRGAGRPSKLDQEKKSKIEERISEEYASDVIRLGTGTK